MAERPTLRFRPMPVRSAMPSFIRGVAGSPSSVMLTWLITEPKRAGSGGRKLWYLLKPTSVVSQPPVPHEASEA